MNRPARTVGVVAFVAAALAGCGDDDDYTEPDPVGVGEQQRQACVEREGRVALIEDDVFIGCVTIEEYEAILKSQPDEVVAP